MTLVLHPAQTLKRYRVDMLNSGYYIVLINSHEDIFRYISGHAVLDEDDQDRAENVTRFFLLSPSESSVFQVCTEKITVYRINLLKVQKLVHDTLLSGYDIYPIQLLSYFNKVVFSRLFHR